MALILWDPDFDIYYSHPAKCSCSYCNFENALRMRIGRFIERYKVPFKIKRN